MPPFQKLSTWWLGPASQHPLSRPSSFHGVEHGYRFVVMQSFNNVQMNGWSCSPKNGPAQLTVLSHFFVRMTWSFSKTFKSLAKSCYLNHGLVPFTMLNNLSVCMLCSHFKNIHVDGWAALPNIPCHGPVRFTALNNVFVWMLCRHSTTFKWTAGRASPKHGPAYITVLSQLFVRMKWSLSITLKTKAGSCSSKHRPVPFTVLKNLFVWMLCSLFENIQVDGWAALPNNPCHGPASFAALNNVFVWMLCRLSTTCKWTAGRAPPNTVQLRSRFWVNFSSGWRKAFQKHSNFRLGRAPPNTAQFLPWCWRTFSSGCYAAISKTFKLMAGPRSPTLLSRPNSFCKIQQTCRFDVKQTFNNVLINGGLCSPKHGPAHVTVLKQLFVRVIWSSSKTCKSMARTCFPKHGPIPFTMLKNLFVWMLCSYFKNIQVDGWAAFPNIPCHGPAHFAASKNFFLLMLCWFSTAFKWTTARAPPNTVKFNSRRWVNFWSGWHETFLKHSKFWLGRAPPNTVQFYSRCYRTFSCGCYAAIQKHSSWWLGRAPQHPLSRPSSIHGVKHGYRFNVMQIFNNVQLNGWSCSPKHGPAQFTMLSHLFVWMAWSSSKTFKSLAKSCYRKHGPVHFTMLTKLFVWMLCSLLKTFKLMAGPRFPTSPVTAQFISRS